MRIVIAAIDNSSASTSVVNAGRAFARLLGANAEAIHVLSDGGRTARNVAEAARLPLRTFEGPVVESIVRTGRDDDVVAVVIGARSSRAGRHALGETAAVVATSLDKPVLIVPPEAQIGERFDRVLVPLEGSRSAALTPRVIIELEPATHLEAVALHVYDEQTIPPFTDRPEHEHAAWEAEFLRRYCPRGLDLTRLETRVGRTAELVAQVADECACDLIALGWSQALGSERAFVVRGTLERSRVPVLLVPVVTSAETRNEDRVVPRWQIPVEA
jgi:nucleotide-binding universal stress UspA family protein